MADLLPPLTRDQHNQLNQLMIAAFPGKDLERLAAFRLGTHLETITRSGTLADQVFDLIRWCEARGQMRDLIQAAVDDRPSRQDLVAFAAPFGIHPHPLGQEPTRATPAAAPRSEAPTLSVIERADRYRALKDAVQAGEWRHVVDLAVGIESFRDVGALLAQAEAEINRQPRLMEDLADAYADGNWMRVIQLAQQLGPDMPPDVMRWLNRAWQEVPTTQRVLNAHNDPVACLVITPEGHQAISGAEDRTLKRWDLTTGEEIQMYTGHTAAIEAVVRTADGRYIVSGADDDTIRLWDLTTGDTVRVLTGHRRSILSLALSPDGRYLLSGSKDTTIRLWDLNTGETVRTLEGHHRAVRDVAFTPDGRHVLSASADRTVGFWDVPTGQRIRSFEGHIDEVHRVAALSDGHRAISGSADTTMKCWDLRTGTLLRTFEGHSDYINALKIMPNGRQVLSGAADKTLRLWDIGTGQPLWIFYGHKTSIRSLAVADDGRTFVSGAKDGTIRMWVTPE